MAEFLILLVLIALAIWGAIVLIERRIVYQYQHALLFEKGRFVRPLDPGAYWLFKLNNDIKSVDARLQVLTVPGQDILSKDGVTLKVSALVHYQITDPQLALLEYSDFLASLYAMIQTALRERVGNTVIEELLQAKNELGTDVQQLITGEAAKLGLTIQSLSIKDIMFPGPLKESFSQVARARQQGLAALERARGESAALRKLANAAKMFESNPELYKLRVLQSVTEASSVIVNLGRDEPGLPANTGRVR